MEDKSDFDSEEKIKKYFIDELTKSGYFLENKVQVILHDYFETVRRSAHYLDKEGGKDREIDFVARTVCHVIPPKRDEKPIVVSFELIVECKKSFGDALIFSGIETDRKNLFNKLLGSIDSNHTILPDYFLSEPISTKTRIIDVIPIIPNKLFTADSFAEFHLPNGKSDGNKIKIEKIYEAILQVTKATRYRTDYNKNSFEHIKHGSKNQKISHVECVIFQPIIVFDGRMYEAIQENDQIRLNDIQFARLEKEYVNREYNEVSGDIHIVSITWLRDYLNILKQVYDFHIAFEQWRGTPLEMPKDRRTGML